MAILLVVAILLGCLAGCDAGGLPTAEAAPLAAARYSVSRELSFYPEGDFFNVHIYRLADRQSGRAWLLVKYREGLQVVPEAPTFFPQQEQ